MRFLEQISAAEAMATTIAGTVNGWHFARRAGREERASRRVAAAALIALNVALAAEGAFYLAFLPSGSEGQAVLSAAVRTLSLAATLIVSLLILRRRRARGGHRW
jgi:hypothetical protein